MAPAWRARLRAAPNWRVRLRVLHERVFGLKSSRRPVVTQARSDSPPLAINLGIDFGTSFTKVAFRDVGTEETAVVTFGGLTAEQAMIPSVVGIDRSGRLFLGEAAKQDHAVRYLKMRIAGVELADPLPVVDGIDLNAEEAVRALSSWFLASVAARAKTWVLEHEADRARGREVQWSANVGVPVEHYDSNAIDVFKSVLAVGWAWLAEDSIPDRLDNLITKYHETVAKADLNRTDCHAMPEIAAAVHSFIISGEAQPGIYVYFDIGGGTVDGVAFNYINLHGERRIDFYSGKVAPLGVAVIANHLATSDHFRTERVLVSGDADDLDQHELGVWSTQIQRLVADVIVTAKRKDGRSWQRDLFPHRRRPSWLPIRLEISQMAPLPIFVGGGGAGSRWYQRTILSTYENFGHINAGIPPYELTEAPKPSDLEMEEMDVADFRRFAIAYGLSVPFGEGPEIGLPSQFAEPERPKVRQPKDVVDYLDSKDAYG